MDEALVVGELSLDGTVRHTRGFLPMALTAKKNGFKRIIVLEADAPEAALIPDLEVIPVPSLAALFNHLTGRKVIQPYVPVESQEPPVSVRTDFSEIKGQESGIGS